MVNAGHAIDGVDGVVGVVDSCGGVDAEVDAFAKEFSAGDGDEASGVEDGSGLVGSGVPAPIGVDVNVFGDIGDEPEAAFAQGAAALRERRRLRWEGLNLSVFR